MKRNFWLLSALLTLCIACSHGVNVDYADVKCFLLSDHTDNNFVPFRMDDRTKQDVSGFIAQEPFLTRTHLVLSGVTIGRSYNFPKKGKALLNIPLTDEGQALLAKYTEANVGLRVAIFTGRELVSAPKIQSRFSGPLPLEGGYSDEEAQNIASLFKNLK